MCVQHGRSSTGVQVPCTKTRNHDECKTKYQQRARGAGRFRLIGRYVSAGVELPDGSREATPLGVPQGGPLSPLLENRIDESKGEGCAATTGKSGSDQELGGACLEPPGAADRGETVRRQAARRVSAARRTRMPSGVGGVTGAIPSPRPA